MNILLRSDKTFRGPFTAEETARDRETVVELKDAEYADWSNLHRPHPGNFPVLFDPSFRYATLAEAIALAPTVRAALILCSARITDPARRAKIMAHYAALDVLFDTFGDDGGRERLTIKAMIEGFDTGGDSELELTKAQMIGLPQWK